MSDRREMGARLLAIAIATAKLMDTGGRRSRTWITEGPFFSGHLQGSKDYLPPFVCCWVVLGSCEVNAGWPGRGAV